MKKQLRKLPLLLSGIFCLALAGPLSADHPFPISSYTDANSCLGCHSWADDMMDTIHWTWEHTDAVTGQEDGKVNVINNYCVAVSSNEPRCTSCHIGVGWRDDTFDFTDKSKIDCLVCHDGTGTYKKTPTGAGAPDPTVDLLAVANSASIPDRNNCGICHFYGGGGDGVKHGDLDSSMADPSRDLDVHMGGSMDFSCIDCHVGSDADGNNMHDAIMGTRYSTATPDHMLCESCHTSTPEGHSGTLNAHTSTVACQTCHIPTFARGGKATKMYWDWSTAGEKNPDGTDKVLTDEDGNVTYHTKKGTFVWEKDVVPEYTWFNGTVRFLTAEDTVSADAITEINAFSGDVGDANARIFPIKRFRGLQPFDDGTDKIAVPHLFPYNADDTTALWKTYDWTASLTEGQASIGKTFVGPIGWVETEMIWVQNHMVAPKEQALSCSDCHVLGGRLNFADLGYAEARSTQLQLMMQSDFWAGFPVHTDGVNVDTGNWLGWVNISFAPWIYCFDLEAWMYVADPDSIPNSAGAWMFIAR
jgi:octaheme c-type cytochrome (tetrathionate reductase family)